MAVSYHPLRRRATEMLLLATLFWGISFPVMKAIGLIQHRLLAHADTWFAASSAVMVRFGLAALLMLAWTWRSLRRITGLEVWQGFGLGACAGMGMLFQVDGLSYTTASVSAFLTQCCCLILPWFVAARDRAWPSGTIILCSMMAAGGVAVLTGVDLRHFRLGRGEWETLISSVIFTGQILWLERPVFAKNRVGHFTLVMFVTMTLFALPVAILTTQRPNDWVVSYTSPTVVGLILVLVIFCTMVAFVLMNHWQPILPAAEAGLIYAAEPIFASLFALFLPGWLSAVAHVDYPNEKATSPLLLGGGLITAANVLVQIRAARMLTAASPPTSIEARSRLSEKRDG
ncbi:MAG: DMT family transporter [Verrucomicrobiota bacterium]